MDLTRQLRHRLDGIALADGWLGSSLCCHLLTVWQSKGGLVKRRKKESSRWSLDSDDDGSDSN